MRIFWRILVALVLIAAVAGIGFYAYNAGLAHAGTQITQPDGSGAVRPYFYSWHPFAWFGWGPFGCLIPLFLLFVVFGSVRALFWPRPWGWHHMHRKWWREHWDEEGRDVPPFFDEWHRRAHEHPKDEPDKK